MPPALSKTDSEDIRASGYSFFERFLAWWEGYDLPPVQGTAGASGGSGKGKGGSGAAEAEPEPVPEWSESREVLVQMLWGDGFNIPGEPHHILDLVKPFGLTGENTLLEIGAGLGGDARMIAEDLGTYVEGFDLNADIAKKGAELSKMAGLDTKAKIKPFTEEKLDLRSSYYDGCLIRETLMAIEDEQALLEKILNALKPHSSIVIADFFLPEPNAGPLALAALEAENRPTYPTDSAPVISKIEALGFELRINNDETESYAESVRQAWAAVAGKIKKNPIDEEVAAALLAESELWKHRFAAFEAEELCMRRIVCFKQSQVG